MANAARTLYTNLNTYRIWSYMRIASGSKILQPLATSCSCHCYCTQTLQHQEVTVAHRHGLTVVRVPLPSRQEVCEFTLKPLSHTIGDFVDFLKKEDGTVDLAMLYNLDGCRIALSSTINSVFTSPFELHINDKTYSVTPPAPLILGEREDEALNSVKSLISDLYSKMNLEEYQIQREELLKKRLETIKLELLPLEQDKMAEKAHRHTVILKWTGLGLMGLQFGVLARLTWWEYSWDIMEPVTYFVTYGTAIAMYAYFVMTKQEYVYPDVRDRHFLLKLHKSARLNKFDVHKFNRLKHELAQVELDLQRLRDPLQLHLPIQQIMSEKL